MTCSLILSNTNSIENAKLIANTLVKDKLAACVNIIPQIKSIYFWNNEITEDDEYLMVIKTKKELFENVKNKIVELHTYEVPEIISFDITNGEKNYLDWIENCTKELLLIFFSYRHPFFSCINNLYDSLIT